jgi:hypothetical protein
MGIPLAACSSMVVCNFSSTCSNVISIDSLTPWCDHQCDHKCDWGFTQGRYLHNNVGQQHGATARGNSNLWGRGWRLVEGTDSENRTWARWSHNFSMIMWLTLWLSRGFKFIVLVCILSLGCSLQVISFLSSCVVLAESAPLNTSNTQAQFELTFSQSQLPWTLELRTICSTVSVSVHHFHATPRHCLPIISSFIRLPNLILVQLGDLCAAIHPQQITIPTENPHSHFVHHCGTCT